MTLDGLSISGNARVLSKMELKVTNENGKTKKVSDFQMNADDVLYIKIGPLFPVRSYNPLPL